jgi:hypothetical protein
MGRKQVERRWDKQRRRKKKGVKRDGCKWRRRVYTNEIKRDDDMKD